MRISDWSSDVCSSDLLGLTAGGRTDLHGNGGARGHCPDAPAHFCGKDTRSLNPARDDVSPRLRSVGGACSPKRPDAQRDARSVSGGKDSAVVLQQRRFSYLPANNATVTEGSEERRVGKEGGNSWRTRL